MKPTLSLCIFWALLLCAARVSRGQLIVDPVPWRLPSIYEAFDDEPDTNFLNLEYTIINYPEYPGYVVGFVVSYTPALFPYTDNPGWRYHSDGVDNHSDGVAGNDFGILGDPIFEQDWNQPMLGGDATGNSLAYPLTYQQFFNEPWPFAPDAAAVAFFMDCTVTEGIPFFSDFDASVGPGETLDRFFGEYPATPESEFLLGVSGENGTAIFPVYGVTTPEPSSIALLAIGGIVCLGLATRRRHRV